MENQHRKITGYRELSEEDIHLMNEFKRLQSTILNMIHDVSLEPQAESDTLRSCALAKTNIQQGVMWAIRAVTKPSE